MATGSGIMPTGRRNWVRGDKGMVCQEISQVGGADNTESASTGLPSSA